MIHFNRWRLNRFIRNENTIFNGIDWSDKNERWTKPKNEFDRKHL